MTEMTKFFSFISKPIRSMTEKKFRHSYITRYKRSATAEI